MKYSLKSAAAAVLAVAALSAGAAIEAQPAGAAPVGVVLQQKAPKGAQLSAEEQLATGVTPGLVRLAVGIEGIDDILADLTRGLAAARSVSAQAVAALSSIVAAGAGEDGRPVTSG